MKEITAKLNSYRQSPRKVRLVADSIRGKNISEAKNVLSFLIKRSSGPLFKLLNSAIANAKNVGVEEKNLFVKEVRVDGGTILYRRMPVAHGSAHPIRKRTSHVKIVLAEKSGAVKEAKKKAEPQKVKSNKSSVKS